MTKYATKQRKRLLDLLNDIPFTLGVTLVCAIILLFLGNNSKIKGDASIAMLAVGSLAVGYLLINLFSTSVNLSGDVCSTLFGSISILTLTRYDVILCIVLSISVLLVFILFYNKIFAVTFDEDFSKAIGVNTYVCNFVIALIIAIIIVLAMNLVGSLLITALVIFPAISAMGVCKSFLSVTICSACISVIFATLELFVSILFSTPVGSTIVVANMISFFIFYIVGKCMKQS